MSWRSLLISNPARLCVDQSRLVVAQQVKSTIPLADISVIVLDNPAINLTHGVLSACGEHGIVLFATNQQHLPSAVCLPYLKHSRVSQVFALQQHLSKPQAKQIWATIVRAKIRNQATCLGLFGTPNQPLLDMANRVTSGDSFNREAQAAAWYFVRLFGNSFSRKQDGFINSALNYGYAIFRGAIARCLVAHGLHPPMGLHHHNSLNPFNLADDLIEPFRPMIDAYVRELQPQQTELSSSDKAGLVDLLNHAWQMPSGITDGLNAMEQTIESLVRAISGRQAKLLQLPQLVALHKPNRAQRA